MEILTRGLGPFAVHSKAIKKLSPYLKNCDEAMSALEQDIKKEKKGLSSFRFSERPIVFFLGEFKPSSKPPRLVIGNDGFVSFFSANNGLKSYPSSLQYISWSPKILHELSPVRIGVAQGKGPKLKMKKVERGTYNISHAGALSPGLGQIRFMSDLIQSEDLVGAAK